MKLELKDLDGARKELDKAEKILDSFDSVETIVHAAFYRVNAEYYQVRKSNRFFINQLTRAVKTGLRIILPERTPLPCLYRPE